MSLNVKKLLRHMNRGILLGSIIFIALVIYLVVDSLNFKRDIPMFEKLIEDYYAELSEIAVSPEENRKVNDSATAKKEMDRVKEEYAKFIDENWVDYSNGLYYYYVTKQDVKGSLDNFNNVSSKLLNGYVVDWKYKLSDIKVSKLGPNMVGISYTDNITVDLVGNPLVVDVLNLDMPQFLKYARNYEELKENTDKQKYNRTSSIFIKLMKVDGEWKIYGSDGIYNNIEIVGGDDNA